MTELNSVPDMEWGEAIEVRAGWLETMARRLDVPPESLAILVVDHGSRREESNQLLDQFVHMLRLRAGTRLVEPAHMELAEPSIRTAFAACVRRGARAVLVSPFFLAPGKHWTEDIPRLVSEAAESYPDVRFRIAPPLGPHPLLADVLLDRATETLEEQRARETTADPLHARHGSGDSDS